MLEIKKGNTALDLPEDIAMSFEWNSPILDTEVIQGEFSLPVKLPETPLNQNIMQFAEVIDNRSKFVTLEGWSACFEGIEFATGKLKLMKAGRGYEAALISGTGDVASVLRNKKISELDLGGDREINDAFGHTEESVPAYGGAVTSYQVFGSILYTAPWNTSSNQTLQDLVNLVNANAGEYFTAQLTGATTIKYTAKEKGSAGWPTGLLTQLVHSSGTVNFDKISELKDDDIDSSGVVNHMNSIKNLSYPDADYAFPTIKNEGFYSNEEMSGYGGYVNYYHNNTYQRNESNVVTYNYMPFPYLFYILDKVAAQIGYSINGTTYNDEEMRRLLLYNTHSKDAFFYFLGTPVTYQNIFDYVIDLKNHVPDLTIGDLLNSLRNAFCLAIIFNSQKKSFEIFPCKEILNSFEYIDLTDKVDPYLPISENEEKGFTFKSKTDSEDKYFEENLKSLDDVRLKDSVPDVSSLPATDAVNTVRFVTDKNQYYISTKETGTLTWKFYSENAHDYVFGEGEKNIETGFSSLLMYKGPAIDTHGKDWLVPAANQPGNTIPWGVTENIFSPRLLFYRGMQQDSNGNTYPMASSGVHNYSGSQIGNLSLFWAGSTGLFETCWKEWANFLANARTVPVMAKLSAADLKNFDWKKKIRIGNTLFIPAKLSFTAYKNRISTVKMDLLKVEYGAAE